MRRDRVMQIGIPRERKSFEGRVGMIPAGVRILVSKGHSVRVEKGAGIGSGFSDAQYRDAGAVVMDTAEEVWKSANLIVKVKEPVAEEYGLIQEKQTLFTYFHLAAVPELAPVLL